MSKLLLALVLATPTQALADGAVSEERVSCTVSVHALDANGRSRSARRVSASVAPVVVFSGRVSPKDLGTQLLFDIFSPRGQRYQVLLATPRLVTRERDGLRFERATRTQEAGLAVAGSSIAWASMYGKWRVEPRIEGSEKPCGRPEYFTIRR